jgi:hypothetical protein
MDEVISVGPAYVITFRCVGEAIPDIVGQVASLGYISHPVQKTDVSHLVNDRSSNRLGNT